MKQREKVVPLAAGEVLEIGAGGGLNLPFYDSARVTRVIGLDVSADLLTSASRKAAGGAVAFEPLLSSAARIPLSDGAVDTVLVTYTLCSIDDLGAALGEMRRVLRPGGQLIFCEHGAAPDRRVRRLQKRLTPVWKHFSGNCHLDRDTLADLAGAGFRVGWNEEMYLPGTWKVAGFNRWGVATPG
jgi:ubiquinone/menaquinone biosynthesis C-methylase UbiE